MTDQAKIDSLMLHYLRGRQDMDTRRTRKNGWNEILTAYMGKLPANWPFLSVVTDPRIRTALVEKDARLINAKLRGRLVPRQEGSQIKAEINNALLDFQWDFATEGGSMLEKIALASQYARLFGAAYVLSFWDVNKNTNEIKLIDPRDVFFDGAATHVRNARWVQIREFTTWDKLEARGFKVSKLKNRAEKGEIGSQWRSTSYESIVKANRGLYDRVGEPDDPKNPIIEVITEWSNNTMDIFLPRFGETLQSGENPYKHKKIPVSMLRYHPLIDDIYGETDVEYVLPLQRAINATLCGFIDQMTIEMRPPLKISSRGVRTETIEYGPGAQWIMDNPNMVTEMQFSAQTIANFNSTYPALVASFNTAMGDSSLGVSNVKGQFTQKTATEVRDLSTQQNTRDQSDQNYLAEFLKDIMMMWLSNNKQYLFDDPTKKFHLMKIVGKDQIKELQALKLDGTEVRDEDMSQIQGVIDSNPQGVTDPMLNDLISSISVPTNPVVLNPDEPNPENYQIKPKLEVVNSAEANLYITEEDFEGDYEYIPDVTSMSAGALQQNKDAKNQALALVMNPAMMQLMQAQGDQINVKELLISVLEDAGYKDAEGLFTQQQQAGMPPQPGMPLGMSQPPMMGGANGPQQSNNVQGGRGPIGPSPSFNQPNQQPSVPNISQAFPG